MLVLYLWCRNEVRSKCGVSMNLQQARRTLGITPEDDKAAIKKKYRHLMGQFHPDAQVGENALDSIRRAQEINEAYEYLKSIPASSRVVQPQEKAAGVPPPALERRVPGRTDRRRIRNGPAGSMRKLSASGTSTSVTAWKWKDLRISYITVWPEEDTCGIRRQRILLCL